MKLLFLLKKNLIYGSYSSVIAKSGLLNSAQITSHQLSKHLGYKTHIEVCVDGNEVDKFVHKHKPQVVILEAIWVTPHKLQQLVKLHPRVIFVVLCHSEVAFLSNEGNAIEWIQEYELINNVFPAFNSESTYLYFKEIGIKSALYLPNVYFDVEWKDRDYCDGKILQIGCFGAVRPFKNQLIQAMAAKVAAKILDKHLHFHMNTTRVEQGGEGTLKNIRALLGHSLREHGWNTREKFYEIIGEMDLTMQVSFTESFNIVAADSVHENVPCIVSPTISWMPHQSQVSTEDMNEMVERILKVYAHKKKYSEREVRAINNYNKKAIKQWFRTFDK